LYFPWRETFGQAIEALSEVGSAPWHRGDLGLGE
jgi:hypothetical protein